MRILEFPLFWIPGIGIKNGSEIRNGTGLGLGLRLVFGIGNGIKIGIRTGIHENPGIPAVLDPRDWDQDWD